MVGLAMRNGEFPNGSRTLRAKIDMASPNLNMRDPVMYRILRAEHHRTGNDWLIYPMYDYTHGECDSIEGITHSICTLEFEDHRPLYDWCIENLPVPSRPRQTEFARLNLGYTVLSKRYLTDLVRRGIVSGWDDPRMPTLAGLRRRGVPPEAIREFVDREIIPVAKELEAKDEFQTLVKEIGMQIAASSPQYISRAAVPADLLDKERAIYRAQMENSGKPANVIDKIVEGRLNSFYKDYCLEEQAFVKDPKLTVGKLVAGLGGGATIRRFARVKIGED